MVSFIYSFINTQILNDPPKNWARFFTRFRSHNDSISSTLEVASSCSLCAFVSNPCIGEGREQSQLRTNMLSYGFVGGLKHNLDGDKNNPPKNGGYVGLLHLSRSLVIECCVNILPTWREERLKLQPAGLLSMETFELWSPLGDVKKMRRLGCPIYVLRVHSCGSVYMFAVR